MQDRASLPHSIDYPDERYLSRVCSQWPSLRQHMYILVPSSEAMRHHVAAFSLNDIIESLTSSRDIASRYPSNEHHLGNERDMSPMAARRPSLHRGDGMRDTHIDVPREYLPIDAMREMCP
jgi:hypothetical protein